MNHTTKFTAAALVGFVMTGCQGASGTDTLGGVASTKNGILTTQSARIPVAGRDYTTLYSTNPLGKLGARVGVQAIREDGSAVIVKSPLAGPGEFLTQSQVGIQKGRSRTWFPPQTGSQPRQAHAVAAHGESIVWLETKSTDIYYQDWRVYSGTIGKSKPILLADSFSLLKTDQIPYPPGVTTLSSDAVNAWWVMVYPTKKAPRGWAARIMVRDVGAHNPLKIAVDGAMLPAAIAQGLIYVRQKMVDPSMTSNHYEIRLLKGGVDTLISSGPLIKDEAVLSICASNNVLAWAVHSPSPTREKPGVITGSQLHVMTLATKVQRLVNLEDDAWGLSLGCGTNFVAWGNGSGNGDPGQYVLNVASGKIFKLGSLRGISMVHVAGHILAWALPPKSAQEGAPWRVVKWHGA
jgi:hypothetical protein